MYIFLLSAANSLIEYLRATCLPMLNWRIVCDVSSKYISISSGILVVVVVDSKLTGIL